MAASKKERRELAKQLKAARAKRVVLLKQVEKSRTKFERRSRKLEALETKVAELIQRVFGPDALAAEIAADEASPPRDEPLAATERPTTESDANQPG